jgi:hypothetical protein
MTYDFQKEFLNLSGSLSAIGIKLVDFSNQSIEAMEDETDPSIQQACKGALIIVSMIRKDLYAALRSQKDALLAALPTDEQRAGLSERFDAMDAEIEARGDALDL